MEGRRSLLWAVVVVATAFRIGGEGTQVAVAVAAGTADGSEEWGYVEVRPKAHMFWWLYRSPQRDAVPESDWPIILWLQGGPGGSGVGIGNFLEIGPLNSELKPRNWTWLQKADLLFVDNPVGAGYSYVEDESLLVKTDEEAATDLTKLLIELFNSKENLQNRALFLAAESYGGKYAVTTGLAVLKAIQEGKLKLKLGGVVLGDSWISPEDFVFSWGPLLRDVSRLDSRGLERSNSLALKIRQQLQSGQYGEATNTWSQLESVVSISSNSVDFYNFMLDADRDPIALTAAEMSGLVGISEYSEYLSSKVTSAGNIGSIMNGVIREKLKIIPKDVKWGGQSNLVFSSLQNDFMKPRIKEVDELLSKGVNVTVYNGQLDVICATKGTEAWIEKLKWEGLQNFTNSAHEPLFCEDGGETKAFRKSYTNLHFYWVLGAGHFVPVDQPCVALKMVGEITQSPAPLHNGSKYRM
ncbi:hypothetical protein H6P81_017567 [Aristolochia fimbriata]|uniref:Carboxypeptidase n=1 Tax=Aristolochia fimbriata TaxID=158543 RepID=A0AAV7DYV1_ARIFI|nr:hypothetical protein H6P81_017567 [Aristolochia fimbriata]